MNFSLPSVIFILVALVVSVVVAIFTLKLWDETRAEISVRKIIGSTKEQQKRDDLFLSFFKRFSFNKDETKKKLVAAGIYSDFIAQTYYLFKIVPLFLTIGGGLLAVSQEVIDFNEMILIGAFALIIFVAGPDLYLSSRTNTITRHVSSRLPFLLDLMNVCVHTGMTIEATLEYLAKELQTVDKYLAFTVNVTVQRSKVIGIEKALEEFYEMVPSSEAQSFVMTLVQSLKFGSSVGQVLGTLATDIRQINMMELEEKIGKLGAKMSIPMIVFIMVPIIILIIAPGIMRMLTDG
ncbi:TPA: type II secretion system F family protein [Vibrio vulnificus]|uniref:type II secretion system F family protein n=1 Tax=Vibrio vulnificus TaxID=672 RepID=UPI0007220539|nr:type II secretion system F family protein [Vibrio vulnificus]ALM72993.1 putative type II/IV secretion system protein TadC [Vibrio vulnificus]ANH65354.1 Type II/IV secretion system protein TadC, associated with Flp pilus assembly [Vibrio vulnificus]EGQ8092750.1 type II secretion system F family protein [Vibrio vulnificus]EHH0745208.1 type II secretion system F family protein [Vibrio vulnificus]HAS6182052.1 type II secretion system F family protein [Vibrio vulnificus]